MAIMRAALLGAMVVGVDVDEFQTTFVGALDQVKARIITSVLKKVDVAIVVAVVAHAIAVVAAAKVIRAPTT